MTHELQRKNYTQQRYKHKAVEMLKSLRQKEAYSGNFKGGKAGQSVGKTRKILQRRGDWRKM